MDWIIYLFVFLILLYIHWQRAALDPRDMAFLWVGVVMLAGTLIVQHQRKQWEGFAEEGGVGYQPISSEEDYSALIAKMTVYLTMFNKASFPQTGNKWINVAYDPKRPECKGIDNRLFTFENPPIFSTRTGIAFGSNRLYGPYSNELGISLQSTFTIFMCVKHGDFTAANNNEIELLKLYANSGNNNALALYVKANTVEIDNNVQKGQLMIKFVDNEEATPCLLTAGDTAFTFDRLNPSFFFVIKEVDKIRVAYMVGGSSVIRPLATITTKETIATFSNKELVINRFQNWKASMYAFGILNEAVSDSELTAIYSHVYAEYLKVTNDDYLGLVDNYNSILENLKKFTACPYDEAVCRACNTVTKWNDTSQVLSAPTECRTAISTFCKANPKHPMCKCWDTNSADYKTQTCTMYRQMFDPSKTIADSLRQDDLDQIKNKFNLIYAEECPKPQASTEGGKGGKATLQEPALLSNVYQDYDLAKLQIKGVSATGKTLNPYKLDKVYEKDDAVQDIPQATVPKQHEDDAPVDDKGTKGITNPYGSKTKGKADAKGKKSEEDDIPEEIRRYVVQSDKVTNPYLAKNQVSGLDMLKDPYRATTNDEIAAYIKSQKEASNQRNATQALLKQIIAKQPEDEEDIEYLLKPARRPVAAASGTSLQGAPVGSEASPAASAGAGASEGLLSRLLGVFLPKA